MTTKKTKRIRNIYHIEFMKSELFNEPQNHLLTNITIPFRIVGRNKAGNQETFEAEIPGDYLVYLAQDLHKAIASYEERLVSRINEAKQAMKGKEG